MFAARDKRTGRWITDIFLKHIKVCFTKEDLLMNFGLCPGEESYVPDYVEIVEVTLQESNAHVTSSKND